MMPAFSLLVKVLSTGFSLAVHYWYTWLPLVLGLAAYQEWFAYQQQKYLLGLKWTVLEILAPPEVPFSSPRAAENFFAGLHVSYSGGTNWKSQFFQGKLPTWFSFEIVSNGGETHFFIRCTEDQRNVVEALIFAQYPDAEIRVVPDHTTELPVPVPLDQYDVSGAEMEFVKEQVYPIKTYPEFEEAGGKDEYARLDPIAPLMEIMSALRPGERLTVQYLIRGTGGDWAKENQKVVDKMLGKEEKPAEMPLLLKVLTLPVTLLEMVIAEFSGAEKKPEEKKKEEGGVQKLTPVQKDVLEKVEQKMAKLAFKTGIRVMYTAPKDAFNGSRMASVSGMFKQLYHTNLNSFKPGNGTRDKGILPWLFPTDKGFFADARTAKKKQDMVLAYRYRMFPFKVCILTTEELATLWHLPGLNVKAPLVPRVQAKKGQPPVILPTR